MSAPGPLPSALAPFARLASIAYGLGVRAHGAWWSLRGARDAGVPVISVGNVSAGGTGKSPFVRWVAEELVAAGHRPVVALRGYAPGGGPSDEAAEHRATLPPGATVAVGADRVAADLRHRDHHRFTAEDAARIAAAARAKDAAVLCTGKDWAKLEPVLPSDLGVEWLVVRPAIAFLAGEDEVRAAVRAAASAAA